MAFTLFARRPEPVGHLVLHGYTSVSLRSGPSARWAARF